MNLSKSTYCQGIQCEKMLWLNKHKPEVKEDIDNESVLTNGTEVGELAKSLFGKYIDIKFNEDLSKMIDDTKKALEENKNAVITEASFNYKNNFCSVDILIKKDNNYEIYEVKSSTEIKDIYLDDISYQYYILNNLGYNVKKTKIVYINKNYIRNGFLDLKQLFKIKDTTNISISKQQVIKDNIDSINKYMQHTEENPKEIGIHCYKPYPCPFFKYCKKHLPERNIFDIKRMKTQTKLNLYNQNIYTYEDLLKSDINNKYKQQIEFELYEKPPIVKKEAIKKFLDTLTYPLYFLDFETYQESIPKFDGISPYMQIPFQYSLHYLENENSSLQHKEFLSEPNIDPRRTLAEHLVNDIPKNACVLAYNMMFEKMVIRNLANLYEDLSDSLMNIYNNIKDLMVIFQKGDYYKKEMHGSYSIKYVLPALFPNDKELNYQNLDLIHNGQEASHNYMNLPNLEEKEQEKIKESLLKYCELDTYAMVKIWQFLKEIE